MPDQIDAAIRGAGQRAEEAATIDVIVDPEPIHLGTLTFANTGVVVNLGGSATIRDNKLPDGMVINVVRP